MTKPAPKIRRPGAARGARGCDPGPVRRATTLVELTVAMAVMAVVFAAAVPLFRVIRTSWEVRQGGVDLTQNGRILVDHLYRNLAAAKRVTSVSDPGQTQGYLQFLGHDDQTYRYGIGSSGYVEFGPLGGLGDLAGPVSSLRFVCYDDADLATPVTDGNQIRLVKVETTLTGPGGRSQAWTASVRLRCDGGPVQARGLVGRWRFDEGTGLTVLDSSDSGAHGTLRNMTGSERTAGVLNRALGFDGSNDYVDLPIGPLIGSADSITVATWARFLNTGGSWQRIFDFGTDTNAYMFLSPRTGTSGAMRFAITTGGSAAESVLNSPTTLPTGWHHVAVTIDGPTRAMRLYLDGAVVAGGATAVLPSALGTTTRNYLGRSQYSADGYYSGRLDDFRIYDTVLTSAQVGDLYAVGNLVQHLPLDETWGTTAQDQVGTANGTLVNGPVWTTGTWGGALSLDGANDYVSSFRTVQYHMTLAAWVRTTSAAIGPFGNPSQWWDGEGIVDASRSGNYDDFGCSNNRGKFVFGTGDLGRTEISVLSTSLINDGSWHHVAATRDGSTGQMTVYVDGVPEAARVGYTGQLNSATAMRIGGILDQGRWPDPDPQRLFLGRIDDVRIYGRVLTADQILLLLE